MGADHPHRRHPEHGEAEEQACDVARTRGLHAGERVHERQRAHARRAPAVPRRSATHAPSDRPTTCAGSASSEASSAPTLRPPCPRSSRPLRRRGAAVAGQIDGDDAVAGLRARLPGIPSPGTRSRDRAGAPRRDRSDRVGCGEASSWAASPTVRIPRQAHSGAAAPDLHHQLSGWRYRRRGHDGALVGAVGRRLRAWLISPVLGGGAGDTRGLTYRGAAAGDAHDRRASLGLWRRFRVDDGRGGAAGGRIR